MTEIPPILSHTLSSSSSVVSEQNIDTPLSRRISASSVQSFGELAGPGSSSSSIQFADGDVEIVSEEGLKHAKIKLRAKYYKTPSFSVELHKLLRKLHIPTWEHGDISPVDLRVQKVAGALTNAVFFVSYPPIPEIRTVLLRIYGPSSGSLISRPRELHTLHVLSSQYQIGPRVYGTFDNGRVEEHFESSTLTAADLRDPLISEWIGARMAELHSVDVEAIEETSPETRGEGKGWEIGAKKNVKSWLVPAAEVLELPGVTTETLEELDLDTFKEEWSRYMQWLSHVDDTGNGSRRVFAHNDTQYGNLLRVTKAPEVIDGHQHRQIVVVDFEYASPNPASFDIANHFHEWTANYHSSTPHILDHTRYPTFEERCNFYRSYIRHMPLSTETPPSDKELRKLDEQVRFWSPASHAMWTIWGIVQAREDVEDGNKAPEFDYIGYARCRMAGFRREIKELGL